MIVAYTLDTFDCEAGHRESFGKLFWIECERYKLTEPVVTDLHLILTGPLNYKHLKRFGFVL